MTTVYRLCCTPWLSEDAVHAALPYLNTYRCNRIRRIKTPLKRAQCVATGLLLRHLLGADYRIQRTSTGKPILIKPEQIYISLSHSGEWVFCALSDGQVGVDAQEIKSISERIYTRCFSPEEQAWIATHEQGAIRLWTRKEALGKYTGEGLTSSISAIQIPLELDKQTLYWDEQVEDALVITLCAETPLVTYRTVSEMDIQ